MDPRPWLTAQGLIVPAPGGSGLAQAVAEVAGDGEVGQVVGGQIGPAPLTPGGDLGLAQPVVSALPAQVGAWKGEQVTNAAYVIKAGQARSLDVWTITVAVMTAMAESSLTNVAHGDAVRADTIGLFQNGPERGPYEQRMDPTGAANIFYDYLLRVPGYHDLEPTIAAHKAQRNADPYHYQSRWPDAVQMVATLTDDPQLLANLPAGGAVQGCQDGGPGEGPGPGDGTGAGIVAAAQHYLGTPYSWGGGDTTGPTTGISPARAWTARARSGSTARAWSSTPCTTRQGSRCRTRPRRRARTPVARPYRATGPSSSQGTSSRSARTDRAHPARSGTWASTSATGR